MSIWLEEEKLIRIAILSHEVVAVDSSFSRRRFEPDPPHSFNGPCTFRALDTRLHPDIGLYHY